MKKQAIVIASIVLLATVGIVMYNSPAATGMTVVVYKNPGCVCCSNWADKMREAGFTVEVHESPIMSQIKAEHGVAPGLASCHTALVDGYVIEGHVPPADVTRLLAEKPAILGLAVPGMPVGSPGMEMGSPADYHAYDIVAFDGAGRTSVYRSVSGGINTR